MLSSLRISTYNAVPVVLKRHSIAYRCLCNLSYNTVAKRNKAHITNEPKKASIIRKSSRTDAFTYKQPLAHELNNVEEYKDYVDSMIFEKIKTILKKHDCEDVANLNKLLEEYLKSGLLQKKAFDSVNKQLVDQIRKITSQGDFKIYYPSNEQVTSFALFTNKVFTYLEMILSDTKNNKKLTSGDVPAALANDEAYKTAMSIFENSNLIGSFFLGG